MNDKELLEAAANAIGMHGEHLVMPDGTWVFVDKPNWNPLRDDGDALRLAVKLGINIQCKESGGGFISAGNYVESVNQDKDAAIRRVIVRAAAEIGKAIK